MASLKIQDVWKRFDRTEVLEGIDLHLEDGEFLVLVGPSGCGKTTLLNLVAGLETPTRGEILIDGRIVNDVPPKDRDIAMVFQSYALYPTMTVRRNITFGLEIRRVPRRERDAAVARVAEMLQIGQLLERKPAQLSGGQRQRVAMGRALVRDPAIFLFDEPLSNLDAKLRVEMRHEIKRLHQTIGRTVVYVTHDQVEAMTLATRIAVMHQGVIQQYGAPAEIYERPANLFVAGFMGSPPMNFLEGTLVEAGGNFAVAVGEGGGRELRFPLPDARPALEDRLGQPVILGLRPESLSRHDPGRGPSHPHRFVFEREIEMYEPTGADTMAFFTLGGATASARLRPQDAVPLGAPLALEADMAAVCLFDPDSGRRL